MKHFLVVSSISLYALASFAYDNVITNVSYSKDEDQDDQDIDVENEPQVDPDPDPTPAPNRRPKWAQNLIEVARNSVGDPYYRRRTRS